VLLERCNGSVGVAGEGIQIQASKPDERKASRAAWKTRRAKAIHLREASKGAKQLAQSWKAPRILCMSSQKIIAFCGTVKQR